MASCYITPAGHAALTSELDHLWRRLRPEVTRAVTAAAAEGDRSENAEYIYRKKQLREIDRRVRYLRKRLDVLVVVAELPRDRSRIYFGASITVEDNAGALQRWKIVGADEIDPGRGCISVDSPVALALLKKRVGDEVQLRVPAGEVRYRVRSVDYENYGA